MRLTPGSLISLLVLVGLMGCGGDDGAKDVAGGPQDTVQGDASLDLVQGDLTADTADTSMPDATEDTIDTVEQPKTRLYTFKGLGGVSMGASALTLHSRHPGTFDAIAAMGGYVNFPYMSAMFGGRVFSGFCPMEQILAHLDEVNDPDSAALDCGLLEPELPWEWPTNYNNWYADDSGGTWDRTSYFWALGSLLTGFGNFFGYNPENPYTPAGVPLDWFDNTSGAAKCDNPYVVGKPNNYSKEFNPEGEYNLITYCDGEEPIDGGESNPDYWTLKGAYDPTYNHTLPVHVVLAVDYNGNGKRDYHEPVVVNSWERFEDVGADSCDNSEEDGQGGCTGGGPGDDPNGDDFDLLDNPFGTEGNRRWDEGEPYEDFGLDGVNGTGDLGEEDGEYTRNPNLQELLDTTAMHWIDTAPQAELDAVDIILDGGIRDVFCALTSSWELAQHLLAREPNTRFFDNYSGTPQSFLPSNTEKDLISSMDKLDWTEKGVGKNFIVQYGFPDATPEEIEKGDGKHVGSGMQILNRVAGFVVTMVMRWPEPDKEECLDDFGRTFLSTFYSEAMQNRFGYAVALPPCYDKEASKDKRYPMVAFLPGHGMKAMDMVALGTAFAPMMMQGKLPKFVLVAPEGQCCRINLETGDRYCACNKNQNDGSIYDCVDPTCKGAHEDCPIIPVPSQTLTQECNGGCFYANQKANRFGSIEGAKNMRYEDMIFELMDHLDATYRLRQPAEYEID